MLRVMALGLDDSLWHQIKQGVEHSDDETTGRIKERLSVDVRSEPESYNVIFSHNVYRESNKILSDPPTSIQYSITWGPADQ